MSAIQADDIEALELEAELLRRDFRAFVRAAWHEIDPAPLVWGWHMDVICLALEAVARGQVQRLIINIPPGHAKSMLVSVLWPAWRWARDPKWQVLTASHNAGLSTRDAVKARTLMSTTWYTERFRRDWGFAEDQNLKTRYQNTKGGTRQALSVGSGNTGWRGDCVTGETLIATELGQIPVATLAEMHCPPRVWSFNGTENKYELTEIQAFRKIENRPTVTVATQSGLTLRCTHDHRIYSQGVYQTAKSLTCGSDLLLVPKEIHTPSVCRNETTQEQTEQPPFLQSQMLFEVQQQQKEEPLLPNVQRLATQDERGFLRATVPPQANRKTNSLPTLRQTVQEHQPTASVLQPNLCQRSTFNSYARQGQFSLQNGNKLCGLVSWDATGDSREGRTYVRAVRGLWTYTQRLRAESEREIHSFHPPHQSESERQQPGKPDNAVRELSHSLSRLGPRKAPVCSDTVLTVQSDGVGKVTVYDLQVARNHNFFANSILVHNCLLVDDPLDATDAHSQVERERVIIWKTQTMTSRFNNLAQAEQVIIMQRLHEQDLTGYLLANEASDWQHLCLPSKFEPDRRSVVRALDGSIVVRDPRKKEGELLFPVLFSSDVLAQQERSMGSYAFAGQHQQRPVPASGGMLKREWFRKRWSHEPKGPDTVKPPAPFDDMRIFVDASFKGTKDSDRVAIGVFGKKGPDVYLLDMEWRTMGFVDTINALTSLKAKWPKVSGIFIEDKANGSAIIDTLKSKLPGIVPIQPEGGKEARVAAASPYIEAGNCILPESAPWVADAIAEACSFPKGLHDDFVDVLAYAMVNMCSRNNMAGWLAYAR